MAAVLQKKDELASEVIENGEEDELEVDDGENKDPAKKKKKKKKKKKAENESDAVEVTNTAEKVETLAVDDAADGDEKKKKKKKNKSKSGKGPSKEQTNPPTIPISELYPDGHLQSFEFMQQINALLVLLQYGHEISRRVKLWSMEKRKELMRELPRNVSPVKRSELWIDFNRISTMK
ncbi:Methionine aminopeptidase 2 [Operophtera brumata]|uniref:Methionine aminopeptidase 2 n=1 Tax=Operophtera brumata TaxID=104452 RepID=A0A0L7KPI7_OPEBR|nr:Methionine aminopeptidase 2 [Operophtera brumata]